MTDAILTSAPLTDLAAIAASTTTPTARTARGDFSYAKAAAALETKAGAALKAHGGRGETSALTTASSPAATATRNAGSVSSNPNVDGTSPSGALAAAPSAGPANAPAAAPTSSLRASPPPPAPAPLTATPIIAPAPAAARSTSIATALTSQPPPDPARPRAASSAGAAEKSPAPAAPAAPTPADVARLVAQRLGEDATQFDLRLDPTSLGAIEGRLVLEDDGAARLTLTFENRETFDQFARDEAGLRAALDEAGFSFGEGALEFTLKSDDPSPTSPASPPQATSSLLSTHAVDIIV
jgi:flagellar hook-length control protein FliK